MGRYSVVGPLSRGYGTYFLWVGHPVLVNLTFNDTTLICTSTGGPATTVTWTKNQTNLEIDGTTYQQSQTLIDTQNAEYSTMLTLPTTSIEDFDTTYECIVENSRGSGNASLKLEGIIKFRE